MLSVLLPESFGSYPLPLRCLVYSISRFKISPEVRQSPVILMTSLGYYLLRFHHIEKTERCQHIILLYT